MRAGFWIRFLAYLIDYVLLVACVVVACLLLIVPIALLAGAEGMHFNPEAVGTGIGYGVSIPLVWLYYTLFESSRWQATPGKRALGLEVIDEQGNRIRWGRANARYWSKLLSGLLCGAGFLMIGLSASKQGLHDRIAHTLVVRRAADAQKFG
jgi:uncharacterized RDD family membrane protein YckC